MTTMPTGTRHVHTYCRICEAHCGLVVEVGPQEEVVSIKPDKGHPVSKGFSCLKGTSLGGLHHDPDRLNYPMKRVNGVLQRISWEQAIHEIGARVRALRSAHGDRSIAMYQGNPTYFSFQNILYATAFLESIGSPNLFASHSVDVNNKLHASTEIFGRSMVHPIPDMEYTEFLMILGSNPVVSQMSVIHLPNPVAKLKAIEARGGRVVLVDPRRTETAQHLGQHVFIRPGTDVYLLLGLLHTIVGRPGFDPTAAYTHADGVDQLVAAARAWSPEVVAPITGIDAAVIRELACAYAQARGASLYMSTGVNMGPHGTLCYWLVQGLSVLTGNLDRRGGMLVPRGAIDSLKLAQAIGLGGFDEHRTLVGQWHRVAGCFPSASLAEEIETPHPQHIRALFVSAGNPVHSLPQGRRLAQAMQHLDLLVAVDIYPSETTSLAHYVLPATDMLERSDFPVSHMALQETSHAQFTSAVVAQKFERRTEWQIYSDLALACGARWSLRSICNLLPHVNHLLGALRLRRSYPPSPVITPETLLGLLLRWGGLTRLAFLKKHPQGQLLPATEPGSFLGKRVPHPNGKLRLWPAAFGVALGALRPPAEPAQDGSLQLIGQRQRKSHNSWMHNNPALSLPDVVCALMHPDDARARRIGDGDRVALISGPARLEFVVRITQDILTGVVAVPHGWGHQGSGLRRASQMAAGNVNDLIPSGAGDMEALSGQAIMLGHPVQVERAGAP